MAQYAYISATSQVKTAPAKLKAIFVSAASGTPTITVYDSDAKTTTTTVVGVFTPVSATSYQFNPTEGLYLSKGLYIVIGGTVTATVVYD